MTPSENVLALMQSFVETANAQAWDRIETLLSPTVIYRAPPHVVQFPGNVVARLRMERQAFPDLHLEIERSFASVDGAEGTAIIRWTGRRLPSRICLVFGVAGGRIDSIESYGGLARLFYDVGLLQPA
jgi:predicted ester cyclase